MQCIICYEKKWVFQTECHHHICISCLFTLPKDECPYCREKLFTNFPEHLKSFLNITKNKKKEILDVNNQEQFPPL